MNASVANALLNLCDLLAWHICRLSDDNASVKEELDGAIQHVRDAIANAYGH